nr:carbamoyl phosphate synthase [Actinomycetota bacterium]
MFSGVLIANRGEIAVRIARTCRELGVRAIAVYSDPDSGARHVACADEAVHLPGRAPADTYLDAAAIVSAAHAAGAEAVHPGYGFLAEDADFARAVNASGLAWVGPPPEAMELVADKLSARRLARDAGVPSVPGMLDPALSSEDVAAFGAEHGYPVAVKAAGGGGGRGLKVVWGAHDADAAYAAARREGLSYFGADTVYVERYLDGPKHMEVQILAPGPDEAMALGVRDCSLQRGYQKLIEESPPPLWGERAHEMSSAAVALSKACGYVNAGTVEFLVDDDGRPYFLEVNARLQVEHTVTEEVSGIDLVACQLRIASGEPLGFSGDIETRGHAIECRVNAEDPARGFMPSPGTITAYREPGGLGVRVDSGYGAGDTVPDAYDSLMAKVIVWGAGRSEARARMLRALDDFVLEGVTTNLGALRTLVAHEAFSSGRHTTATLAAEGVGAPEASG